MFELTRRNVLKSLSCGFGYAAFAAMAHESAAKEATSISLNPLAPKQPHDVPHAHTTRDAQRNPIAARKVTRSARGRAHAVNAVGRGIRASPVQLVVEVCAESRADNGNYVMCSGRGAQLRRGGWFANKHALKIRSTYEYLNFSSFRQNIVNISRIDFSKNSADF